MVPRVAVSTEGKKVNEKSTTRQGIFRKTIEKCMKASEKKTMSLWP
jgi:hypothetical protein